jgi:hypothetical protein
MLHVCARLCSLQKNEGKYYIYFIKALVDGQTHTQLYQQIYTDEVIYWLGEFAFEV